MVRKKWQRSLKIMFLIVTIGCGFGCVESASNRQMKVWRNLWETELQRVKLLPSEERLRHLDTFAKQHEFVREDQGTPRTGNRATSESVVYVSRWFAGVDEYHRRVVVTVSNSGSNLSWKLSVQPSYL